MRLQEYCFNSLVREYEGLKKELFGECSFIVVDYDDPKQKRYNQLFMWSHPQFRTKDFIDPLKEMMDNV